MAQASSKPTPLHSKRFVVSLLSTALIAVIVGDYSRHAEIFSHHRFGFLDERIYDRLIRERPRGRIPDQLVLVRYERSERRVRIARFLRIVHAQGASVIGLDLNLLPHQPAAVRAGDARLLAAMTAARPVILGAAQGQRQRGGYLQANLFASRTTLDRVGARVGFSTYRHACDGKLRYVDASYPPNSGRGDCLQHARRSSVVSFAYAVAEAVEKGNLPAGLAPDRRELIDFRGPAGTLRSVSLDDVIDGRYSENLFADKVVLLGTSSSYPGAPRLPTPEGGRPMSAAELDAEAVATILDGAPLRPANQWTGLLILLSASLLPWAVVISWPFSLRAGVVFTLSGAYALLAGAIPNYADAIAWPWSYAVEALVISLIGLSLSRRFWHGRKGKDDTPARSTSATDAVMVDPASEATTG